MSLHDVLIIGGGLAGLTLARQLRRRLPRTGITIVEKGPREVPTTTHKVGESMVEGGTHYLRNVLGLADYLDAVHLPKLGIRVFGGGSSSFTDRFEVGAIDFPPVPSAQVDRGVLEQDLRRMCEADGTSIRYETVVDGVGLAPEQEPHVVKTRTAAGRAQLRARWLIDATGRRRLLSSHLKMSRDTLHPINSSWWRIRGKHNIDSLASKHPTWHSRTRQERWFSTNHMLGEGYWLWVIPLCSDNTSIGIVADERYHPIRERATVERSRAWLREHEPEFAAFVESAEVLDFHALRSLSYSAERAFSLDRWACVGEAFAFPDPLYSVGTDLLGWANTLAVDLIAADIDGKLVRRDIERCNNSLTGLVDGLLHLYRDTYATLGLDRIALYKVSWDAMTYFGFCARGLLHDLAHPGSTLDAYTDLQKAAFGLSRLVQRLFRDWASLAKDTALAPGFYHPFIRCPSFRGGVLGDKELTRQAPDAFLREQHQRLDLARDIALALQIVATREVHPQALPRLLAAEAYEPMGVALDPGQWDATGLLRGSRPAENALAIAGELAALCNPIDPATEFPATTSEIRRALGTR